MDVSRKIYPRLPRWVALLYFGLAAVTVPWTVYLAITLPTHELTQHWDSAWVGLDIAIILMLLLNAIFAFLESKWLVMTATATTTLLVMDAWFDINSASGRIAIDQAIVLALFIELPLAFLTFMAALAIVRHEHRPNKKLRR